MFAVPEVDDDIDVSTPVEAAPSSQATTESLQAPPAPSIEKAETASSIQSKVLPQPPPPPPPQTKQHRSRRSLFHRNTIHICDQIVERVTSSQQQKHHHSASPHLTHSQQAKTGLDAINENGEYLTSTINDQQQQQQLTTNGRFPRSSTVPYPVYATLGKNSGGRLPQQIYYTNYPTFIHGTVSPAQANTYFSTRQPLTTVNNNFQPISPHHHQYGGRPVDILKPTFLIVPRAAEQQLTAQLSASNSPVPIAIGTMSSATATNKPVKPITKKKDIKNQATAAAAVVVEPQQQRTVRSVEVQTNGNSAPITNTTTTSTTIDPSQQHHVGLIATPNPSPYVHFVNVSYPTQSPQFIQDGPPETSVLQDEFITFNEYHQPTIGIQSMPNIAMDQVSPHQLYASPPLRQHQPQDNEQQLTVNESVGVRSATLPQMAPTIKSTTGRETAETDESSVASLDFHADIIDVPGSWRYRSIPVQAVPRRYRAPIPQSFMDGQQYMSDSEQVVRSSSFRHPQQQQTLLAQSRPFGSIPTIHRPFDSLRSQVQFAPSIRLSEKDALKISSFYQSIGALVYVGRSIATLYTSDFDAMANLKDWKKLYTGVPIWLFNTGMNPKRTRCIRLIISELGSSFTLWDTIVNGASDVRLPKPRHLTLKSLETGTILALKFDDLSATDEFHQYFVKLSCDPRNADLFDVFNAKRRRPVFILRKRKVKKSAISKPTEFNHITRVDEHDRDSLYTYSVLVEDGNIVA